MPARSSLTRAVGALAASAGIGLLSLAPSAGAQATTQDLLVLRSSTLVRIAPSAPGTAIATTTITGLNPGDQLIGIDLRPSNGVLYGVGTTGVIYTIDQTTGAATAGPTTATVPTGTAFGVDFNPAADRLRVVSNTGQSLRINVADGATTVDGSLAYAAAPDPGAGTTPSVVAAAYTNPDTDPNTGTELFDIDAARDALVLQNPPNDGVLATRGPLNADVSSATAFDIGTGNRAMAIIGGTLATVDLTTGATTSVGAVVGGPATGMAFVAPLGQAAPTTTTTAGSATTATTAATRELPRTGTENLRLGAAGALLVALGGVLVAQAANRRALHR